jgi:hypothetical protein
MTALKSLTAAALLLTVPLTASFGQLSEPAAFQSQHPDRDVLNGGALTPAARGATGLESVRGLYDGVGSTNPRPAHRSLARSRRHGRA